MNFVLSLCDVGRPTLKEVDAMNKPTPASKDLHETLGLHPAVEEWVERVHGLPGTRDEKVRATREAIRRNAYENEQVLDDTVARLDDELERLVEQNSDDSSV